MKKAKKLVALLVSTLMIMSVWGCGTSSGTAAPASAAPASAAPAAGNPSSTAADTTNTAKGKKIALIPPAMISPYYASVIAGAKKAVAESGDQLVTLAPASESDYAAQVQIVEDMITQKVDGIIICAINSDAIVSAVKKANEAKIPVVMFNIQNDLAGGEVASYIKYDQYEGGAKVCDFVAKQFNGKAKVAIIEGLPSDQTTQRKNGFVETAKAKYPGIEIVASQPGDWEREKGMNAASNMLQAHPEVNVIFALCDEMGLGAVEAVKQAGSSAKVCSFDGNPNAIDSIKAGQLLSTLSSGATETGEIAVKTLDSIFSGKTVDKTIKVDTTLVSSENAKDFSAQ